MPEPSRSRNRRPRVETPRDEVITASAQTLFGTNREQYALQYKTWQDELWAYTRSVGEYGSAVEWYANGFGRIHLIAAKLKAGAKEPERLDKGPAAELVNDLTSHAEGGETQFMKSWGRHLMVPGVGYFIGEDTPDGGRYYDVKSAKVIRRSTQSLRDATGRIIRDASGKAQRGFDVEVGEGEWRQLGPSSLVGRIFDPDAERDYMPTSPSRPALTTLREIDLYNRHIVATLLSRVIFNGMLLMPQEVTFPVNPQFKDAPDPFIAEVLAAASRGIKDPGSPLSAFPLPLRVPTEYIDKFKHLTFASGIDPRIIQALNVALERLPKQLPIPPEAVEGLGDMTHWNAWQADADRVKMFFGAPAEVLVGGLTKVFLHPMLRAANQPLTTDDGDRIVMWYDISDLTTQPDNSQNVTNALDRIEIKSEAYRAGIGLDETDKPSKTEKREQILTKLAAEGKPIPDSYYLLYPEDKPAEPDPQAVNPTQTSEVGADGSTPSPAADDAPTSGPPNSPPKTGPTPGG